MPFLKNTDVSRVKPVPMRMPDGNKEFVIVDEIT